MRFRFLTCELDPGERVLLRSGRAVEIQPKALDVLISLVQHAGETVSADTLLESVWADVQVTQGSVSRAVHAARRAIGDDGGRQGAIETVRGRGFRFVAPIEQFDSADNLPTFVPYVGRERLLGDLRARFDAAGSGAGPDIVLLRGDAGAGKTRTAQEVIAWAHENKWEVRESRAHAMDAPFAVWERLAPHGSGAESRGAPNVERVARAAALARAFDRLSTERPLLLVADDLHVFGQEALYFLAALRGSEASGRWLLVASHRDHLSTPPTGVETVDLGAFDSNEGARFAGSLGSRLPTALVLEIHEHAEGNPLHIRDLLAWIQPDAIEEPSNGRFGDLMSFADLVAARRERRSPLAQDLIDWAAVAGDHAAFELVTHVAGLDPGAAIDARDELETHGWLLNRGPAPPDRAPLAFRHDRVREALYAAIPALERARRHHAIATWLERTQGTPTSGALETLAVHWRQAAAAAPRGAATRFLVRAGELSQAAGQVRRAHGFFERAVETVGDAFDVDDDDRVAAHLGRARTARALGDAGASMDSAQHALAAIGIDGPADTFAEAAWLAAGPAMPYRAADREDQAPRLRLALDRLSLDALSLRARLSVRLAAELQGRGEDGERARLREQALRLAQGVAEPTLLGEVLLEPYAGVGLSLEPERRLSLTEKIVGCGDLAAEVRGRLLRIGARIERGELSEVDAELEAFAPQVAGQSEPVGMYWVSLVGSTLASARGDFASAEQLAQEAHTQGLRIGLPVATPHFVSQMMALHVHRGTDALVTSLVDDYAKRGIHATTWGQTAWFYCERGDLEAARPLYERWMADGIGDLLGDDTWRFNAGPAARCIAAFCDRERARELLGKLQALPVDVLRRGYLATYGPKDAYLGLLHSVLGEGAQALACFDRAMDRATAAGGEGWRDIVLRLRGASQAG